MTFTTFDLGGHAQGERIRWTELAVSTVCLFWIRNTTVLQRFDVPCSDSIKNVHCSVVHLHCLSQIPDTIWQELQESMNFWQISVFWRESCTLNHLYLPWSFMLRSYLCWPNSWANTKSFGTSACGWDRVVITAKGVIRLLHYFQFCKTWNCILKSGNIS